MKDKVPEAAPGAKAQVHGALISSSTATPVWTWRVRLRPLGERIETTLVGKDPSLVEFVVARPGEYDVYVTVSVGGLLCEKMELITVSEPCPSCFRFRVSPPLVDGVTTPQQETRPVDVLLEDVISLSRGTKVTLTPRDINERLLPAYVRIISAKSALVTAGYTQGGPLDVYIEDGGYQVLVVPSKPLAPQIFNQGSPLTVDDGTFVTGRAVDGDGVPFYGTQVILRAGIRPSTIGLVDPRGDFNLQARPGVLSALIAPPPEAGLPEAHVPSTPGLAMDGNGRYLKIEWAPMSRSALTMTVNSTAGTAVAGVHVRAESAAEMAAAAKMTVYLAEGDAVPVQTLTASGAVHIDATSDVNGVAHFSALPVGAYRITLAPPAGSAAGTLTTMAFDKTGSAQSATVALAAPVTLSGTLNPAAEVAGARVIARDLGTGYVADESVAVVDAMGRYALRVAPNRSYSLRAEPPPTGAFARTMLASVISVGAGPIQSVPGTMTLSRGRSFTMWATVDGQPVGGLAVQAFCPGPSSTCLDPSMAIAEAVTASDGRFTVRLPVIGP